MATMNAIYPSENPWSSPFHNTKETPFLSLSFPSQKDYGLWSDSPLATNNNNSAAPPPTPDESWGKTTIPSIPGIYNSPTLSESIPQDIVFGDDWEDDVSVLNDNPEEDDIEILFLPQSTYDVLMPLFDELDIEGDNEVDHDDGGGPARAAWANDTQETESIKPRGISTRGPWSIQPTPTHHQHYNPQKSKK